MIVVCCSLRCVRVVLLQNNKQHLNVFSQENYIILWYWCVFEIMLCWGLQNLAFSLLILTLSMTNILILKIANIYGQPLTDIPVNDIQYYQCDKEKIVHICTEILSAALLWVLHVHGARGNALASVSVKLCVSSKVGQRQPDRFSWRRCQYDRCPWRLELVHQAVLSHAPPDYTGSKQSKPLRATTEESWLTRESFLIHYNLLLLACARITTLFIVETQRADAWIR